ncbi:transposase domain containing protein [Nephila pilipes]|uniref:Transposase domain containing protein n=1 Tax=Nephila pilipes TaxID=299642 RepID=A0A8X6MGZ1_NEPPI|nr:transposase domain containing protein [Nephila pilipes]
MGRQLRVQRPPIRNISDLRDRCLNIWYNLSPVIYQGLVASMPRRVEAVLRAKVVLIGIIISKKPDKTILLLRRGIIRRGD